MPWDGPHTFEDGEGNTASGEQVMENLQFLRDLIDNLPEAGGSGPATVTVLPGAPDNGDDQVLLVDAVNGVQWPLRYRTASASPYKWEAKGATPLTERVQAIENGAGGALQDVATVGPRIVVPNDGDYDVWYGGLGSPNVIIALVVGGVASAADEWPVPASNAPASVYRRKLALPAGTELKMRYKGPVGAWSVGYRWLSVRPVRIA